MDNPYSGIDLTAPFLNTRAAYIRKNPLSAQKIPLENHRSSLKNKKFSKSKKILKNSWENQRKFFDILEGSILGNHLRREQRIRTELF